MSAADAVEGICENILGLAHEEQVLTRHTYIHAPRFVPPESGRDESFAACWVRVDLKKLPGFPLWEGGVHDLLMSHWAELRSIFAAYSAGSGADAPGADTMDLEEFHDFVLEADVATSQYGVQQITGQFGKANAASGDAVLELHEFVSMLVAIAFYRANPQYGLVGTSSAHSANAHDDNDGDGVSDDGAPLPGCLGATLVDAVLRNCRRDDAAQFVERVMLQPDVQEIVSRNAEVLVAVWEDLSEGRDAMSLPEWLAVLDERLLFGEVAFEHDGAILKARFTEPQAKAAFVASVSDRNVGLTQQDFVECLARCGVAKYRGIPFLSPPDVIAGFIQNLVGECDEEEVIRGAKPSLPDGFKSGFKENASKRISTKTKARPSESTDAGAPAAREEAAS